jgi:hypothetical protein
MTFSQLEENDAGEGVYTTPVAIIGMASILPQASNLPEYWDNILRKIDCVIDIPDSRWSAEEYYDPDPMFRIRATASAVDLFRMWILTRWSLGCLRIFWKLRMSHNFYPW